MKISLLHVAALVVGISGATAEGQSDFGPYQSPARWSRFNAPQGSDSFVAAGLQDPQNAGEGDDFAELPAPRPQPEREAEELPPPNPVPLDEDAAAMAMDGGPCESPYVSALSAPCGVPSRPALARYFGGASLLFWTLADCDNRNLIVSDATGASQLSTSAVDPSVTTGFEVYGGRYFGCNQYGLSVGYMLWNPSPETVLNVPAVAGNYRPAMPAWNGISIDPGTGVNTVYAHFDGAAAYRVHRDLIFQGIEANVSCFGIMGARRAASCCNTPGLCGWWRGRGQCQPCSPCKGYGRAGGPIIPSCDARVQVVTSHGFRWFQVEDEFQLAANINGAAGYQADDLYYDVDTTNNLFGYQFGSRLVYCLNRCWNLSIGGKFGLYGNHATYNQRIGTDSVLAYRNGAATDFVNTSDSDNVLSTLGELDLGLGYRIGCAWTLRGGYRLLGVTGIATATNQIASDYNTIAGSGYVCADDSLVLHGGYLGLEYNW